MRQKDQIIVLHTIKHSDTGVVVRAYSQNSGKCAFYMHVGKKHTKTSLTSALSILDIVYYSRHGEVSGLSEGRSIPLITEAAVANNLLSLRSDIVKSTIAVFMCELISKTIREVEGNIGLYEYIKNSVLLLDSLDKGVENFHLHFFANLCRIAGYMPNDNYSDKEPHFNISKAMFDSYYDENLCFSPDESLLLHRILSSPTKDIADISCSGKLRNSFLQRLLDYLSLHLGTKMTLKSLPVLREVFE